jgi:hypothetical protein
MFGWKFLWVGNSGHVQSLPRTLPTRIGGHVVSGEVSADDRAACDSAANAKRLIVNLAPPMRDLEPESLLANRGIVLERG